jgi:hypothetical protein
MNRDNALLVANIVDRITKLEKTIFDLQSLMTKRSFVIKGSGIMIHDEVELNEGEIATVVFATDILELYINTLNLELNELVKSLDDF